MEESLEGLGSFRYMVLIYKRSLRVTYRLCYFALTHRERRVEKWRLSWRTKPQSLLKNLFEFVTNRWLLGLRECIAHSLYY